MRVEGPQTRAEIARARMADLLASFDGQADRPRAPRSHAAQGAWRVPPGYMRALVALAVAASVLLSWWLLAARPRTSEPQAVELQAHSDRPHVSASAGTGLVIDVEGKVRRPGIITLPRGSRVHEAIAKAGGVVDGADTSAVNLARVLVDGEQVIVGGGQQGGASTPGAPAPGSRVSLSSATAEQLDELPGIGPVTAAAIIAYRTAHGGFQRVEDLLDVDGIGEKTLADLRDQVMP
jgi:competence protein ComEA